MCGAALTEDGACEGAVAVGQGDEHHLRARPDVKALGRHPVTPVGRRGDGELLVAVLDVLERDGEPRAPRHLVAHLREGSVAAEQLRRRRRASAAVRSALKVGRAVWAHAHALVTKEELDTAVGLVLGQLVQQPAVDGLAPDRIHHTLRVGVVWLQLDVARAVVDHAPTHRDRELQSGLVEPRARQPADPAVRERQVDRALRRIRHLGERAAECVTHQ